MATDARFHFFEVQNPGQKIEPKRLTALRTHVRRAVARKKKTQPIDYTLKIVTPQDVVVNKRKKMQHRSKEAAAGLKSRGSVTNKHEKQNDAPLVRQDEHSIDDGMARNPVVRHPFTSFAADIVDLDIDRLDQLFKSDAFRIIGEPFFDTSQVDSNRSIGKVFPCSLASPSFMYALVYSMLQVSSRNLCTVEMLHLHAEMIAAVNQDIAASTQPSTALAGAVMLLTAGACRFDEHDAYAMHSRGLAQMLELCAWQRTQSRLTPAASRAVFWLDLFSSICLNEPRRVSHHFLPNQPSWSRDSLPKCVNASELPPGFVRHRLLIPDDLLDCLQDVVELQSKMQEPAQRKDYMLLDNMQASIESRLSFQGKACRLFGDVAEMIRLAAFICCYCCWTDTWNSNVIPSKVAKLLLGLLEESLDTAASKGMRTSLDTQWEGCGDMLLWLIFVGAMVSQGKEFVPGLRERYGKLIALVSNWVSRSGDPQMWSLGTLHAMRDDFLYCDSWIERRLQVKEWFVLEITFGLAS